MSTEEPVGPTDIRAIKPKAQYVACSGITLPGGPELRNASSLSASCGDSRVEDDGDQRLIALELPDVDAVL